MSLYDQIMEFLNGESLMHLLSKNLSDFLSSAYILAQEIQNHVVGPIALSILAIFIMLEFQKIALKVEGAGGAPMLGFEMIIKALFKFAICYIIIIRIQWILDGILIICNRLTVEILKESSYEVVEAVRNVVQDEVNNLSWWEQLMILLVFCIMILAALVVRVLVQVTIYLRFLELYIYCAMAPISMSALPNQEMSSMSKGFFKNFAATGLQSSFIALTLVIYPTIFAEIIKSQEGMWGIILGVTIYMIALLFSINKTKTWAKMLVSAS